MMVYIRSIIKENRIIVAIFSALHNIKLLIFDEKQSFIICVHIIHQIHSINVIFHLRKEQKSVPLFNMDCRFFTSSELVSTLCMMTKTT